MTDWHPSADRLEQFMKGKVFGEESQKIVRHLMGVCPTCQEVARVHFPCDSKAGQIEEWSWRRR